MIAKPIVAAIWKCMRGKLALVVFATTIILSPSTRAQAGFDDDRVMIQGFYWESGRHGYPQEFPQFGSEHWYAIIRREASAIRAGRFDLAWLPPPSFAGGFSAGYNPRQYFVLDNSYGSFAEHRAALEALLENGIEPIADIVINHRDGTTGWADFKKPDWGTWAITQDDEAFTNPKSEVVNTPVSQRGAPEEFPSYRPSGDYAYPDFRDIDHTNRQVRADIVRYLLQLKSLGYRGWRYDMALGYRAKWIAVYNRATNPTFSVGEYWADQGEQRGWIWETTTTQGDLKTASSAFDFSTFGLLKGNKGTYAQWYGSGLGVGLIGDNTNGLAWKNRSVTFIENHDTAYRTNPDGSRKDNVSDSYANNWEVEQAYAQILTHPGVPTVFWKHYFDWGQDLRSKIQAMINARKVAGVHAGSELNLQNNAKQAGVYAARVAGRNGDLFVRIGGSDANWQPSNSNYANYREYAAGSGWKIWVALQGNPPVQFAPARPAFPVPVYRPAESITVSNSQLD